MSVLPLIYLEEILDGPRMDETVARWRALWAAVLERLLRDARGLDGFPYGQQSMLQRQARSWFRESSPDRALVLEMAGVDLAAFISRGLPRLEAVWQAIDASEAPPRYQFAFGRSTGRKRAA